jgi:ABC-type antimicrobial peptide transport system permease subunit
MNSGPIFFILAFEITIMRFQREFNYCMLSTIIIVLVYIIFSFTLNVQLQFLLSVLSIVMGSALVVLGFWGADFAFAMIAGQLHQENIKGKVRGQKNKIYVPFMKNYTPLEWWNLNWFITFVGVLLVALGSLVLGIVFGVYILKPLPILLP